LLVIEAGIDIDMTVMKLVGTRGLMIAVVGSILPIAVGVLLAYLLKVGNWKAIVASGAVFGPTSLGIALNVLKGGKIWYLLHMQ
jgi:Kef-type K+ transport system membrane component KefB